MDIGRRRITATLAMSPLLMLGGAAVGAGLLERRLYLSANAAAGGDYRFAVLRADGTAAFEHALPGRAHGAAVRPGKAEAVIFARRPGRFAIVFGIGAGDRTVVLHPPAGRHFFGHGVFSADGRLLYTTENDFEGGRGVIGIWSADDAYRRVGEMPSHGIGPHEMLLAPDGRTLIVANGGILTHPDFGRRKLNIPTMDPSLAYLDPETGRLLGNQRFSGPRERLLSIRHIALDRQGTVCIALQDQGPRGDRLPLVAFHRRGEAGLQLGRAPQKVTRRLHGYMGSVTLDSDGAIAAVSAPRGNLITFWHTARRDYLGAITLKDGCGVAPDGTPGGFFATSGAGGMQRIDALAEKIIPVAGEFATRRHWDNHLVAVRQSS